MAEIDLDFWLSMSPADRIGAICAPVAPNGGLTLRSDAQRFYEGPFGFPFPMLLSGIADVCEWYDDAARCFRIEVAVRNRVWGPLFGYKGGFQVERIPVAAGAVPSRILPVRTEARE